MLQARPWNHVENTLPDLVEAVGARAPATLEQCLELWWRAAQYERGHGESVPGRLRRSLLQPPDDLVRVARIVPEIEDRVEVEPELRPRLEQL